MTSTRALASNRKGRAKPNRGMKVDSAGWYRPASEAKMVKAASRRVRISRIPLVKLFTALCPMGENGYNGVITWVRGSLR